MTNIEVSWYYYYDSKRGFKNIGLKERSSTETINKHKGVSIYAIVLSGGEGGSKISEPYYIGQATFQYAGVRLKLHSALERIKNELSLPVNKRSFKFQRYDRYHLVIGELIHHDVQDIEETIEFSDQLIDPNRDFLDQLNDFAEEAFQLDIKIILLMEHALIYHFTPSLNSQLVNVLKTKKRSLLENVNIKSSLTESNCNYFSEGQTIEPSLDKQSHTKKISAIFNFERQFENDTQSNQ